MIKNPISFVLKRFVSQYNTYIDDRTNIIKISCYFVDYIFAYLFYGASVNDYFAFGFYKMRPNGRNEYITYKRYHKILSVCNSSNHIKFFRDKSLFNERYAKYLHRSTIDLNKVSEDEFASFLNVHKEVFIKEVMGFRGKSVFYYNSKEVNAHSLYAQLKSEEGKHFIVESKLVQHEALASFHPDSVNTIRVVTVYDNKKDQLHFMFAKIRMGSNGAHLDNTHAGGISGNIDIETGVIITPGYSVLDKDGFIFHPTTGKQIVGFRIPYWQECKRFIEEVARVTPEIRYVGWDVVLMEDGEFALIEANDNADHDGQQIRYKGLWKEYKSLLKQLS